MAQRGGDNLGHPLVPLPQGTRARASGRASLCTRGGRAGAGSGSGDPSDSAVAVGAGAVPTPTASTTTTTTKSITTYAIIAICDALHPSQQQPVDHGGGCFGGFRGREQAANDAAAATCRGCCCRWWWWDRNLNLKRGIHVTVTTSSSSSSGRACGCE